MEAPDVVLDVGTSALSVILKHHQVSVHNLTVCAQRFMGYVLHLFPPLDGFYSVFHLYELIFLCREKFVKFFWVSFSTFIYTMFHFMSSCLHKPLSLIVCDTVGCLICNENSGTGFWFPITRINLMHLTTNWSCIYAIL